jgi:hypothetical protein
MSDSDVQRLAMFLADFQVLCVVLQS